MRPHGSSGQFFLFGWKDIIETKFQAKNEVSWPCGSLKLHTSHLMCFNKFDILQILCSPLFPEWVHLEANAFGVRTLSWVPSK